MRSRPTLFLLRAAGLTLPLALSTPGWCESIVIEATGTVAIAQLTTGPFAGVQLGDDARVRFEVLTPGSGYSFGSGTGTDHLIDAPTFVLEVEGATAGLANGNHFFIENDMSHGDNLTASLVIMDSDSMFFTLAAADSSASFLDSSSLLEAFGTYPASLFSMTAFEVLNGTGAMIVTLESITVRAESEGVSFCSGDGSGAACPCGNVGGSSEEGCANSTGAGGTLRAFGSERVSSDDLGFVAGGLLPGQPTLLFAGRNALGGGSGIIFGDGLRCVGGAVKRLGTQLPDGAGEARWDPGLAAAGGWGAGDVRRFQVWYGDPVGGPCSSSMNLTNAIEITFLP